MARIDMSTDFEADLAKIIDIQKAQKAGQVWRRRAKGLPKQSTFDGTSSKGEQYQVRVHSRHLGSYSFEFLTKF